MSSSYLTRRDLDSLRPDLQKIVDRVVGKADSSVLEEIEQCLYKNGYVVVHHRVGLKDLT